MENLNVLIVRYVTYNPESPNEGGNRFDAELKRAISGGSIAENDNRKTTNPTPMDRFAVSVRGLNFLQKWMDDNLPLHSSSDPTLARELAQRATTDARQAGIPPEEISEEVGSMFTTMLEALENRDREPG